MAGESILVVDDNATNAKLIFFLLKKRGYDVRCAASGEETLALLKEFRPALILMDIQMPGMDGFELSRRLKADPATRDIILIAVTAYAMKGDEQRVREAGCDGYLAKPIDTRALPQLLVQLGADLALEQGAQGDPAALRHRLDRVDGRGEHVREDCRRALRRDRLLFQQPDLQRLVEHRAQAFTGPQRAAQIVE